MIFLDFEVATRPIPTEGNVCGECVKWLRCNGITHIREICDEAPSVWGEPETSAPASQAVTQLPNNDDYFYFIRLFHFWAMEME